MNTSEDRRVRKTKKAISSALAELLTKKPLNNISVREIAELADINRGTFYLHYKDVYDMVETIQNEIFQKFNNIVDSHAPERPDSELFPMLIEFFELLEDNSELAKVLIGKNGDAAFVDKLKHQIREKCFKNLQKKFAIENNDEFNYFYHYIVSGCIGIFSEWLDNDMKESPGKMAELAKKLIIANIHAMTATKSLSLRTHS